MGWGSQKSSGLWTVIAEFALLAVLMAAVPLIVALDVLVLEHGLQEFSVTEFTQEGLLFLSTMLLALTARQCPGSRGFLTLVAGFLGVVLVREFDWLFDDLLPGSWLVPALAVGVGAIVYSLRQRRAIIAPLVRLANTKSFAYFAVGMLLVIVFSRIFGTGQLWSEIMGEDYRKLYKSVIQEGTELLGYLLVFYGSLSTFIHERKNRDLQES